MWGYLLMGTRATDGGGRKNHGKPASPPTELGANKTSYASAKIGDDGWKTPVPLQIDIQHGEASIEQVARDILGLTKLNYNARKLGESRPVTVGFSDAVGEILISNPTVTDRRPNFKFYI